MPELPEVERVVRAIRDAAIGRTIERVETNEDTIVYSDGLTHDVFASTLTGRLVKEVVRYGKCFYIKLDGSPTHPVMHLGMTGNICVKGIEPLKYQSSSKEADTQWPPRFMKFILIIAATKSLPSTEIAFVDPRRLARIRLCSSPATEPPISQLGFDPILSMVPLSEFSTRLTKRNTPVKVVLLDQSFSAGVGNWVADEILFHSRIHPEQKAASLSEEQVKALYDNVVYVCRTAVDVNADSSKFPEHWLMRHRWGKGKKKEADLYLQPSGEKAIIKWITVGGRTSAIVPKVQNISGSSGQSVRKVGVRTGGKGRVVATAHDEDEEESSLSDASDDDEVPTSTKARTKSSKPTTKNWGTKRKAEDEGTDVNKMPKRRSRRLANTSEG